MSSHTIPLHDDPAASGCCSFNFEIAFRLSIRLPRPERRRPQPPGRERRTQPPPPYTRTEKSSVESEGEKVVRRGRVSVEECGENIRNWLFQINWIELKETHLALHVSANKSPRLIIPLSNIVKFERTEIKPNCLIMETNSSFKEHKQYMLRFNNEGDLYSWQDAMSESCCMGVSQPWNFRHNVHVGWDPVLHKYTGLPDEWSKKLPAPDTHPSLGVLRRKLVRFLLPEEGITFTINVERCARGIEVLETVLKKFGKGGNHNMGGQLDVRETDTGGLSIDGWGIYLDLNQEDGRGEALSEAELMSVCHAPLNHPVREHALTLGRTNLGKRCGSSSPSRKNFDKLEPPSETSLFPPQDSISIRPPPAAGVPADVESEDIFVCISINDVSGSPGHVSTTLRLTEDTRMQDVLERVCWKAKLDRTRYGNKAARYGLVVGGDSSLEPLAMDSTVADLQGARQLLLVTLDNSST